MAGDAARLQAAHDGHGQVAVVPAQRRVALARAEGHEVRRGAAGGARPWRHLRRRWRRGRLLAHGRGARSDARDRGRAQARRRLGALRTTYYVLRALLAASATTRERTRLTVATRCRPPPPFFNDAVASK